MSEHKAHQPVFRVAWMLLRAAFVADPFGSIRVFGVSILGALTPVALAFAAQSILAAAEDHGSIAGGLVVLGLAFSVLVASQLFEQSWQTRLEERTDHVIESRLLRTLTTTPGVDLLERNDVQDALYLFQTRPRHLVGSISVLVGAVATLIRMVSSIAYLGSISPVLAIIPLLVIAPAIGGGMVQREQARMLLKINPQMRSARLLLQNAVEPQAAREIRIFDQSERLRRRQRDLLAEADRMQVRSRIRTAIILMTSWTVFAAGFGLVLLAADLGAGGRTVPALVVLLAVLALQVIGQAEDTAGVVSSLGRQAGYFDQVLWLNRLMSRRRDERSGRKVAAPGTLTIGLSLRNVTFRYVGTDRDVLHDINLELPAGKTIAIVGPNGAGKSTLAKLILGLYEPSSGLILADADDLTTMETGGWHARTTAAFQDYARFEFSVQQSVGIGDVNNIDDPDGVRAAVAASGASGLIRSLPAGLATELGDSNADGHELSGGQWQKIAVARAAMRPAASVLVMDEPAANLDAESEADLYRRLSQLRKSEDVSKGRLSVFVAHRFATVKMADLIVILHQGRISAVGTHEELMQRSSWYRSAVQQQQADYR